MSKHSRLFSCKISLPIFLCIFIGNAIGQTTGTDVTFDLGRLPKATVSIQTARASTLSFMRSIAGIDNLAARVSNVTVRLGSTIVPLKHLGSGEYVADSDFDAITYDLDLTPLKKRSASAHASWFGDTTGILMGADMFPRMPEGTVSLNFVNRPASFEIL